MQHFTAMNDAQSRLVDLMICIVCNQTMKAEKIWPDDGGGDLLQYRCKGCLRIEVVRLSHRAVSSP
ncbi:hypothetical protein CQ12_28775 [Bradyrhizobium jicamae]|uniref:Uncharacterized protein n=1 Tax=Bradyrhizobium jicamae TaxID=280332 RepID=A0A0R3M4L5_9BRAD|nr:hypothetical protein CQ12_28775 [Bradyrhizobium jicamae]